jgi:glycosyltransferase involved in cell wall biosynthesis
MTFRRLKFGYVPYSADMSGPGDRRRFVHWAAARGIEFEVAEPDGDYDVVVLTSRADVSRWSEHRGRAKLVYELIDSYLALPGLDRQNLVRGVAKYATRETHRLHLDYRKGMEALARRADAMVCSTEEQAESYHRLCENVHLILDVHTEVATPPKASYDLGATVNLVWEGLPYTLDDFEVIADVLREVDAERPLALHLVTALEYHRYGGRFVRRRTWPMAKRILPRTFLYSWHPATLGPIATASDLAVIPLDLDDALARGKPANKLLGLWRFGLPVVASATPVYARAMAASGHPELACADAGDWRTALRAALADGDLRRDAAERGRAFAEDEWGEPQVLARWDALFESLL